MVSQVATSNTYSFAPSTAELGLYAFQLAGIRPTALLQEHMESLRMAANLVNSRWSAQGVNLWAVELLTVSLTQGQNTYSLPANTIVILDAYVVGPPGGNRIILPISRTEYASYPNPNQQGAITTFWMDRLLSPTVTFYYTPDGTVSQVNLYCLRQMQDAVLPNGVQPEMPFYFLEAYALALAYRLALIWNPQMATGLKALSDEAYSIAIDQNVETSQFYISPVIANYFTP